MHAHEVPRQIFDLIHGAVGLPPLAPPSSQHRKYRPWQSFEIGLGSNRGQAHLGHCFGERLGDDAGFTGRLVIWPANLGNLVRVDDHLVLEVVGETTFGAASEPTLNSYNGLVRVHVYSQFYFGPKGTISRSPLEEIVFNTLELIRAVLNDEDPAPLLECWEAFQPPVAVAPALPMVSV